MADDSVGSARQRRYRLHKSGIHDECLPGRGCRKNAPSSSRVEAPELSPRDAMQRELNRVIARLDVLNAALADRPLDVELLAEARGQQRVLTSLTAAVAKLGPAAPVVPLAESPLDVLRRRRAERQVGRAAP
jgi:hypothetical protein